METTDELYERLASGAAKAPTEPARIDAILDRVFKARGSPEVADRLAALRVAEAIGGRYGLDLVETFLDDPTVEVRRVAFRIGVDAKADGTGIVKEACSDSDADLAADALDLLLLACDKSTTSLARSLLGSPHGKVRARAAALLGHVAGPAVRTEVALLLADDDPAVREAAEEAVERLDGRLPKRRAGAWWDRVGHDASTGEWLIAPEGLATPPAREDFQPAHKAVTPPPAPPRAPVQAAEAAEVAKPPPGPSPEALLRQLAVAEDHERPAVVQALHASDLDVLAGIVANQQPGGDPALARGVCLAAAALGNRTWLTRVRSLADDPDAGVRAAAVAGIAALGGPAVLTQVARKLGDPSPVVQAAAIGALAGACRRLDLQHMLPNWLGSLPTDAAPEVLAARDRALAEL